MTTIDISNEPITGKLRKAHLTNINGSVTYQVELLDAEAGTIIKGELSSEYVNGYGPMGEVAGESAEVKAHRDILRSEVEAAFIKFLQATKWNNGTA